MSMIISIVFTSYNVMGTLCDYAANDDETSFSDWLIDNLFGNNAFEFEMQQSSFDVLNVTRGDDLYFFEYNSESKPTSGQHPDSNWPFENYGDIAGFSLCQVSITIQHLSEIKTCFS